jgi:CarD family transcriptional regulator
MSEESYSKGDWIVHAHYGVGQIKRKEKKTLEGEKKVFLRVKTFTAVYYLPVKNTKVPHIRPLASEYQIKKALSLIRKPPSPLPKNHRERSKVISETFTDVSLYSRARMIRDLHNREMSSKMSFSEKVSLKKLKKQLLNEWSVIFKEDIEVLEEKLQNALRISLDKNADNNKKVDGEKESWLEKVKKGVKERRKKSTS